MLETCRVEHAPAPYVPPFAPRPPYSVVSVLLGAGESVEWTWTTGANGARYVSGYTIIGSRRLARSVTLECGMKNSEVPMMALRRAVQLCNGLEALGDALMVSTDRLERMLSGEDEVPHEVFTQAVGLLLEITATRNPKRGTPDSNEGGRKGPRH
jgi:hypothetical protein